MSGGTPLPEPRRPCPRHAPHPALCARATDSLLFVEQRGEQRVQLVGYDCRNKGTAHIARSEVKPVGAAADAAAALAFWSDDQNNAPYDSWLNRARLNGSDATILFNAQLWDPQVCRRAGGGGQSRLTHAAQGMDTDTKNRRLFFTERQGGMVRPSAPPAPAPPAGESRRPYPFLLPRSLPPSPPLARRSAPARTMRATARR